VQYPLTDDQLRVQELARQFADREVAPHADANSRAERYPVELVQRAAELGFCGVLVPKEYGGKAWGNFALTLILEEVNRACASTGVTLSVHNSLVSNPVRQFGSEWLKQKYLPALACGERIGAYCLTEPHSGSDAAALSTSAIRDGDTFILTGTKFFITTGSDAGLYVVFARTDAAHKTRGITAFVIEREAPGLVVGKHEAKLGLRASHTTEILLQECRVPLSNVLGQVGEGFKIAMQTLDGGRVGIATQSVGIAQACVDAAARFALEHTQFGQPLATFQAVQNRIASMATEVEASRLLTYNAARLRDLGEPHSQESAMAKLFSAQACNRIAREAVQICGVDGLRRGADVERYLRDARVTELYEGTTEIQKLVIGRAVLKKYSES